MRVCAIVVTYNRKNLLKKCIENLISQTIPLNTIFLIDNCSNDNTQQAIFEWGYTDQEYIKTNIEYKKIISYSDQLINFIYIKLAQNIGGAGGFNYGLRKAYSYNFDWYWIMDDDTEPRPDTLENLLNISEVQNQHIGYVCSKVLWKYDHTPHIMTIPAISSIVNGVPFNFFSNKNLFVIKSCAFVSVIFAHAAIQECGLPIKEYFIWNDDVEYTSRISQAGYIGIYNNSSIVYHNTPQNMGADIFKDSISNLWKYRYGVRNEVHFQKKSSSIFQILKAHIITALKILYKRHDNKIPFFYTYLLATFEGIFFAPKIEHL